MSNGYAYWKILTWRFIREALAAGVASVMVLQLDVTKPEETAKAVATAFVTGSISVAFKWFRDKKSEGVKDHWVNKLPL